ncbi:MAG TPA: protein kinase [Burkholderiales bacterium]|nr:protein kinase [Burkholderiales bacterium]
MSERDDDRTVLGAHIGGGAGPTDRTVIAGAAGAPMPTNDGRTVIADHGATVTTGPGPTPPVSPGTGQSLGHNALSVGTKLGEFEITGLVGEGGFGIVYLAYDHSLERQVALKEYMPSELASRTGDSTVVVRSNRHADTFAAGMRSFINEAKLLAQFDHPSLVKVYRFWEANGTAYMVMPFYEGITLKSALNDLDAPPDETWLKTQLASLLDALEIIHNRQCYHRDIAPDNIMILPDETPLLLDFGAARRVIGDMTQALTVILKPGYAPIEQYAEVPNMRQGPWTDLYALASVVYFAIEGKAPVPAVARVMSDPLVPLAQSAAGRYSDPFLRAIDKALSVKPEDRPQNIAEFRQLLGFVERAPTTRFLPTGVERRSAEDRIQHDSQPTVAPTVATPRTAPPAPVSTSAASAPAASSAAVARPAPVAVPAEKETGTGRSRMPLIAGGVGLLLLVIGGAAYWAIQEASPPTAAVPPTKGGTATVPQAAVASAADVNAKLAAYDCAHLEGAVNGGTVMVEGFVSRDADLQRINTELSPLPGVSSVNRSAVKVVPPPHCQVVSALSPYMTDPNRPSIGLKNGATTATEGQKLVAALAAAPFGGYIYADLYDTEGNVVHMLPHAKERSNKVEPGQKMTLGDDPFFGMQWDLVPPFGKHMLVVMQSPTPLFLPKTRPDVEKASAYLAAIKEDVAKMRPGDKIVAGYALFDFVKK